MKNFIPNSITAGNLFFGCLSIVATFDVNLTLWGFDNLSVAAIYIGVAAILDFLDGFTARLLKGENEMGKQLDSLADIVSFGVAPGMIFYALSEEHLIFNEHFLQFVPLLVVISYLPFLIPIFSAVRLAKFNIDKRQSDSFIGIPTPAVALFICSIPFVINHGPEFANQLFTSVWFFIFFPILTAYLLIAELPLFALKFKHFHWQGNEIRFVFLGICLLLLFLYNYFGISLSFLLYVLLSLINNFRNHKK